MKFNIIYSGLISLLFIFSETYSQAIWGRLANPGFENQPVKSVFFFSGNARDGNQYYDFYASPNTNLYTIHPADSMHLNWSVDEANRGFVIDAMINSGINVINMSYWGPPGTDNWAWWAPMQTSTASHDELFNAVLSKPILIAPYIESYASTPNSPEFNFMDIFPGSVLNPPAEFIDHCVDLIQRYLLNPQNAEWPEHWARIYDQSGVERYLISVIHVASNQSGVSDVRFADGFDLAAEKIYKATGIKVGFAIDVLPTGTSAPGSFRPDPQSTGPYLAQQQSILAIQCFISEIWQNTVDEMQMIDWKRNFASQWMETGIPFIMDISPGYDAHLVFPGSVIYGNNSIWRDSLTNLVFQLPVDGVTFNSWNGYTEGMAGVPTVEFGDENAVWMQRIFKNFSVGKFYPVPGKIEAEAYSEVSGVNTESTSDAGGGLNVGWIDDGDWMEYDIAVLEHGLYQADFRVAKNSYDFQGEMIINLDGRPISRILIPGTGDWQNWTTVSCPLNLSPGTHKLRLSAQIGGWNINWMRISLDTIISSHIIPGKVEAEEYSEMYGVETEMLTQGIINIGWFDNGDWVKYDVNIQETGDYDVLLRVSQGDNQTTGRGILQLDDKTLWTFDIPFTGGWDQWNNLSGTVGLDSGKHTLKIYVENAPWNLDWMEFTLLPVGIELNERSGLSSYDLISNYPNPFNSSTTISYQLPENSMVTIKVFNISGQEIETIISQRQVAGYHQVKWDAGNLPSGLYIIKMETGKGIIRMKKCMLLK
ncbi:MAG: hypothetical protein Kow00108_24550 [Calditrichia bacterium]